MKIFFSKKFLKDIEEIHDKKLLQSIEIMINEFKTAQSLTGLTGIRKMTGYEGYYRIRSGSYRLGFKFENDTITLLRLKHRKDIYDVFP